MRLKIINKAFLFQSSHCALATLVLLNQDIFKYKVNGIMQKIILALMLILFPASVEAARAYTPVDQLGHGEAAPIINDVKQPAMPSRGNSAQPAQANLEEQALAASAKAGGIHLFGTVEFQRPLETLPGWLDVIRRNKAASIFEDGKHFNKSTTWGQLRSRTNGKNPLEQLRVVNSFWNTWPYKEDRINWNQADYWAIPAQFLQKSGDCEDYAIVKYFTLKELGFDPKKMRIVVLRDTIRNLAHAVLVVYLDNEAYVLDNLSNVVLSHKRLGNYSPQYSVNEYGRWAHIKGKPARKK